MKCDVVYLKSEKSRILRILDATDKPLEKGAILKIQIDKVINPLSLSPRFFDATFSLYDEELDEMFAIESGTVKW